MDFAAEIKRIRKAVGMKQGEFASAIGASQGSVSKWEGGKEKPTSEYLLRIQSLYETEQSQRDAAPFGFEVIPELVDVPLVASLTRGTEVDLRSGPPADAPVLRLPQHPEIHGKIWAWSVPSLASGTTGYKPGQIVFSHDHELNDIEDGERVIVRDEVRDGVYSYMPRFYGRSEKGLEWFTPTPLSADRVRLGETMPMGEREAHGIVVLGVVFASFRYESMRQRFWDGVWAEAMEKYSNANF